MATEKRLIDANALMKAIKSFQWFGVPNTLQLMFDYLKIIIRDQPTVDAVEVVHGRWKAYPDEYQICGTEFVCSNCNASFVNSELASDNDFLEMMKFCPNCGADMRERKDND